MRHRAYMINGGYADAEMFAAAISDLLAAAWTLRPPDKTRRSDGDLGMGSQLGLGNVTDEKVADERLG